MVPAKYTADWPEILPILRWNSAPSGGPIKTGPASCTTRISAVAIELLGRRLQIYRGPLVVREFQTPHMSEKHFRFLRQRKSLYEPSPLQPCSRVRRTGNPW